MLTLFKIGGFSAKNVEDFTKKSFFIVFVVSLLNFDFGDIWNRKDKI